jgi:hypothetical protein
LAEGLQRVSTELFRGLLQAMRQEKITPAQVHDARKIIKNLRAMLRLTRGAMSDEVRRARNQLCETFPPRCLGREMRRLRWPLLKTSTMKARLEWQPSPKC